MTDGPRLSRARSSVAPELLRRCAMAGKLPQCVVEVEVEVERVYFHCARAIQRSRLWDARAVKPEVPSAGAMLEALTDAAIDGAQYDRELPARQAKTLD